MTALEGDRLRFVADGRPIFAGISLRVTSGRMLALRGPSGSGKSSLLAVLGGLVAPAAGTVTLDGEPIAPGMDPIRRRRFGLVLQGFGLVAALTAHENVAIVLQETGASAAEVGARAEAAISDVGLTAVAGHLLEDLSGGQRQRVAVARALVGSPAVLLADEPTAELDADNRARVLSLLSDRARAGAAVVVASHDPEVVAACDDVLDLSGVQR